MNKKLYSYFVVFFCLGITWLAISDNNTLTMNKIFLILYAIIPFFFTIFMTLKNSWSHWFRVFKLYDLGGLWMIGTILSYLAVAKSQNRIAGLIFFILMSSIIFIFYKNATRN